MLFYFCHKKRIVTKKKTFISFYRCILVLSLPCLLLPPLAAGLRAAAWPGAEAFSCAFLAAGALLLLLPLSEEDASVSLLFAVPAALICLAGVLGGFPARVWLQTDLALHFLYMVRRSIALYTHPGRLFRPVSVWFSIENHARYAYSLALYLLGAAFPDPASPPLLQLFCAVLSAGLYGVLLARVISGRTFFLSRRKELEIKELVRGTLRPVPPRAGVADEELARMRRLYDRVVAQMEEKHPFLDDEFSLDDLAAAVYSNRSYLSRTINVVSGRNFSQFVNYYRIQYSLSLLQKDPGLSLADVASMSGFHTRVTFNMAFKLNLGETPTQYLERIRSQDLSSQ